MADHIDQMLLHRLQALRAPSTTPERPPPVSAAAMTRAKASARDERLADRLKRLRDPNSIFHPSSHPSSTTPAIKHPLALGHGLPSKADSRTPSEAPASASKDFDHEEADALFLTDDQTLEELLRHTHDEAPHHWLEPHNEVRALLSELSLEIPRNVETRRRSEEIQRYAHQVDNCDDSVREREWTTQEANDILARSQHDAHLEASGQTQQQSSEAIASEVDGHTKVQADDAGASTLALDLPTLPADLVALPSVTDPISSTACDVYIGARLAALRTPLVLPTVPTAQPSGTATARLSSRTDYTDDEIDSWCTVCLDDATLRCLGCDNDPYCSRCWVEMHLGSAAAFDDRTHKSVQYSRKRQKDKTKVPLSAT